MPYKDKDVQRQYCNQRLLDRRTAWLQEHGPCVQCGSWDDLEVDHKDPSKKVTHRIWSYTKSKRDAELAKCQVLCSPCHRAKSISEHTKPIVHGTETGYKNRGCRCIECRTVHAKRLQDWKDRTGYKWMPSSDGHTTAPISEVEPAPGSVEAEASV